MRTWVPFIVALISISALASESTPVSEDWSLHGQDTIVTQGHGRFTSPYSGQNSLTPANEVRTSETATFFLGRRLWNSGALYVNPELSAGSGISSTKGVAGFPNGEIYRVDTPTPKLNLSRLFIAQTFGFGGETEQIAADKNRLADSVPVRRLSLIVGKFSLNDFFDDNSYSHDPRTQFLNWALMDNGAWDYAADTRGYTYGAFLEYNELRWAVRYARVLEPKEANELELDWNLANAHADNFEFEYRPMIQGHPGKVRALLYWNHARMGSYALATTDSRYGLDVTQTRRYSGKWGWGLNLEQEITAAVGIFSRLGWNDGRNETWAFTEIDRTASLGMTVKPSFFGRSEDVAALAILINGLSKPHADYLSAGGYGFLIGDGRLNYAPEQILEAYYLFTLPAHMSATLDYQFVKDPGYNADRGPVSIFSGRVHFEI